jgi:predicted nucleic acid-binding protein
VIFLDTGFLFAYVSEKDQDHERVNEVLEAHRGERLADLLVTTNHVVAETITLVAKRGHRDPGIRHDHAVEVGGQLLAGVFGQVHHASAEEEREAFAYFERHRDKSYSIVDCLSFVIMEKMGIREAWAVDEDFTHRFTAQPGPRPKR